MRVLTLAEVQQMGPGETIPAFRCQIKEVKDFYRGTQKQSGDPFTTQKLIVMDGTALMTVKIWDHPEFTKQWQQVWVVFESGQSKKDGSLIGMKVRDEEYRNRVTRLVEVKESATITQAQPGNATQPIAPQQPPPPQAAPAQMPPPAPVHPTATMPPPQQTGTPESDYEPVRPTPTKSQASPQEIRDAIEDCQSRLARTANCAILTYDAVAYMAEQVQKRHPDIAFENAELHTWARGIIVGMERGCMMHNLPTGKIIDWLKKKPEEQKDGA